MKVRNNNLFWQLLTATFLYAAAAEAQVTAETMIVRFDAASRPVKNFVLRNNGDQPIAVRTESFVVTHPGFSDEQKVPTEDLLVSPTDFSIPAAGERTVRILARKPEAEEQRTYRVSFIPVAREDETEDLKKKKGVHLRVMTGIGILVFVNPPDQRNDLRWERKDGGATLAFSNQGNMNVLIENPGKCTARDKDSCSPLEPPAVRLYSGNTLELKGVEGKIVRFIKRVDEDTAEEVFVD